MDMLIMAKPSDEPCHCHSYEEILCSAKGDALYDEHIKEITQYCQGIVDGTEKTCPYNCFQPFEVLHLHYLSCKYRSPHELFLKVQATAKCHLAERSKDGSECGAPKTTPAAPVTTPRPRSGSCACTDKQSAAQAEPAACPEGQQVIQAVGITAYGASSCQCAQFCVPAFVAGMAGALADGTKKGVTCADAKFSTVACTGTVKLNGWDTAITYFVQPNQSGPDETGPEQITDESSAEVKSTLLTILVSIILVLS